MDRYTLESPTGSLRIIIVTLPHPVESRPWRASMALFTEEG
jgi:hypothetical protein